MGQTISVNGAARLMEALETAQAGTTIELAPGNYGHLGINAKYGDPWGRFAGEVTIRSADPNKPAIFSDIFLRGVQNLTIDGVVVDYQLPAGVTGDAINYSSAVWVQEVANVAIRNSLFDGDVLDAPGSLLDGLPIAKALFVRESEKVVIEDNEFRSWRGGAEFQNTEGLVISGNDVHSMRSEGFNLIAVQDVLIEDNHIHDFVTKAGVADHRDMIQFWTYGTSTPTTDVTIRNNILDSGTGAWTQAIFMRNEKVDSQGGGLDMFYRNIVIDNNVIYNAHHHGITVGETDGLKITNNTVLHNRASAPDRASPPGINVDDDARNVVVTKNIAQHVPASSSGWKVTDNLLVQDKDPAKPNYYADLFVDALPGGDGTDLADLRSLAGGIVEKGGYGSTLPSGGKAPSPAPKPVEEEPVEAPPANSPEPPAPEPEPTPEPAPEPGDVTFDLAIAYDDGRPIDGDLTDGEVLALDDDGGVTLVATPSEGVGSVKLTLVGVHERIETAAPYVLFGDENGGFLPGRTLGAGDYEMVLTAYSGGGGKGSVLGSDTISFSVAEEPESGPEPDPEPAPEPAPPPSAAPGAAVYRWNAGPGTVAATDGGPAWEADRGAVTGSVGVGASPIAGSGTLDASVPGTTPEGIFAHEFYGNSSAAPMGLEFGGGALEDGLYAVRLYMGNGWSGTADAGERVFDVRVEDELFLDDLDLSGTLGHRTGGMFEWRGAVDDGTVDIDFVHGVENPLINGVEIIRLEDDLIL